MKINRQEFYFRSLDGVHDVHAIRWVPAGEPRAVLQIVHGMCEHIARMTNSPGIWRSGACWWRAIPIWATA